MTTILERPAESVGVTRRFRDLESPICDIRNMAIIVAGLTEELACDGRPAARRLGAPQQSILVSHETTEVFTFAVYHLESMIKDLHKQYHGVDPRPLVEE